MQALNTTEIDQVTGGISPIIIGACISGGAVLAAAFINGIFGLFRK
ncbi:class IIb bacteriocin, lactobin A/cerein 7B family [Chitinimonas sp. BJB300]|nr:class IIb bacteriocin, lactobin A/cerein 7B family [Chitinimonas sp. BJB300]TSJ83750.1 class IIb bacteriocin, lactobin A/cerein 7B family [Chitinimonas sp. BJB300]